MEHTQVIDAFTWRGALTAAAVLVLPMVLTGGLLLAAGDRRALPVALIVGLLAAPVGLLLLWQMCNVKATWNGQFLRVGGGLYSINVPARDLLLAEARVLQSVDAGIRTNGVGMPGLRLGWFQGKADRRMFLAVTHAQPILVPVAGYDVVFSPRDPAAFLHALQKTDTHPE